MPATFIFLTLFRPLKKEKKMKREEISCWGEAGRRCKFTIKQQNLTRKIRLVGLWVADETDTLLCSAVLGE